MTTNTSRPRGKARAPASAPTVQTTDPQMAIPQANPRADGLIRALSLEGMRPLLQEMGLRAEITIDASGKPLINSTLGGLIFNVRPGGVSASSPKDGPAAYIDFTFVVPMRIDRAIPPGMVNEWNARKRFARLYEDQGMICLEFDIFLAPGVSAHFVHTAIDLWGRLVGEFQQHLRSAFGAG